MLRVILAMLKILSDIGSCRDSNLLLQLLIFIPNLLLEQTIVHIVIVILGKGKQDCKGLIYLGH